ncbi:NADH:flavin oxidoreductase [Desulfosporosinus sp. PR]|uniref:NADH:flavin oxidoreductase n=1 Tax=Candidatus Desulfosporosinus nitrosoreducens TaxID=3401928 RepID=UPI0027FDAAA8|nr:NADH:flavin oxidoreductase [Desulfosporosinus sp. PR]MDQ7094934.1 NADH:flavin oxidoreductase [Desulfosporosinus sp. PR]
MSYLLKPLHIGALELRNRLVMPPMATAKASPQGEVNQALLDYYAEKSQGGYISLIIIEHSFIHETGKASAGQLSSASDRMIDGLRALAKKIHQNGSKTVLQINHAGSSAGEDIIGTTPVGPSAVVNPRKGGDSLPRELTRPEINQVVQYFQDAARRSKEAGFDGVEIHSAHGYLLNQFFSPLTNRRTDEYGGNVHNRIRIHLEIIEAVRGVVGQDFPVLLRLGACDYREGGVTSEDSLIAAKEFAKAGIDCLDVSGGFSGYQVPGLSGQGYFAPLTEALKRVITIPVILTGGITDSFAAEQLLTEGKADLIGVGRAILADSQWAERAIKSGV